MKRDHDHTISALGWRPIGEATQAFGDPILLGCVGKYSREGYWGSRGYDRKTKEYTPGWVFGPQSWPNAESEPTHWMPLPTPPDAREHSSISTDGPNAIDGQRAWLARQLMDSRLTEAEAFGIIAFHPQIKDLWSDYVDAPKPPPTAEPVDWVLVPREPTEKMLAAYNSAIKAYIEETPKADRFKWRQHKDKRGLFRGYWISTPEKALVRYRAMIAATGSLSHENVLLPKPRPGWSWLLVPDDEQRPEYDSPSPKEQD